MNKPNYWATCADCGQPIASPQSGKVRFESGSKYGYSGLLNVHRKCPTAETIKLKGLAWENRNEE